MEIPIHTEMHGYYMQPSFLANQILILLRVTMCPATHILFPSLS